MKRVVFNVRFLLVVGLAAVAGVWPMAAQAASLPARFAVLAGTAVTCTGGSITGDVGVSPGAAVTGCTVNGTIHRNDSAASNANSAFFKAYAALKALPCGTVLTTPAGTLAGQTLTPGVYCFDAASTTTNGVLTLNGPSNGTWIFKIGTLGTGALTGTGFSVVMTDGTAPPCNSVFWWVAEAATMTNSKFVGTILAGTAITTTGGTFNGNAYAKAAVSMTGTTLVGCTAASKVPGNQCNQDESKDTDENSDKSKDAADSSAPVKSATTGTSDNSQGDSKDDNSKHSNDNDKSDNDKKGCVTESSDKDNSDQSDKSTKSD